MLEGHLIDLRCLTLACIATLNPVSVFAWLITCMSGQIYVSISRKWFESVGCLSDLQPRTTDDDIQGEVVGHVLRSFT